VRLPVKVVPKASRDRVVGWIGGRLKVAVTAAPERGRANQALVRILADALGVAPGGVRIVSGQSAPLKTVEIDAPEAAVRERLPRQPSP
jgi:hypothetical protein